MNKIFLFSIRELIVILLSGSLPIFLSYKMGGIIELKATINGLMTAELLLYYFSLLPVLFSFTYFIDKFLYINPLSKKQSIINFVVSTLYELSANIIGIFRISCGILISFPFLVLWNEPESFRKVFFILFPYGIIASIETGVFYWWFSKLRLKQKF